MPASQLAPAQEQRTSSCSASFVVARASVFAWRRVLRPYQTVGADIHAVVGFSFRPVLRCRRWCGRRRSPTSGWAGHRTPRYELIRRLSVSPGGDIVGQRFCAVSTYRQSAHLSFLRFPSFPRECTNRPLVRSLVHSHFMKNSHGRQFETRLFSFRLHRLAMGAKRNRHGKALLISGARRAEKRLLEAVGDPRWAGKSRALRRIAYEYRLARRVASSASTTQSIRIPVSALS